ncbi:peptidyl-prolyl cis-trans isomerase, FKBP-type [Bifidobacterium gallicum DSM 20093 = LMG 11596]|uniref:Peptidyl-prolyl cis-trans isomerase n=2 Tax=Bifidobacterium gallicum TaxID=78342 RepID=D1NWP6_9BIFI|nr:peptidyl-prolyl cis-trans isomerase, FKBP-type [Bifidobacterium gallicum DSM 20093 = LMG 11596]KFI59059.1 peptidylprolyl isomerase [Bifidobacterium gallicum DSM 20093 = LMG 11596]
MRIAAAATALIACVSMSACGSSDNASQPNSAIPGVTAKQIAGVTATGEPGKKPTISFKTPLNVEDNSYVILQEGNGEAIKDGDRICMQGITINTKDGTEISDTWATNKPDCSAVVTKSFMGEEKYNIFKSMKINGTVAFGSNDQSSASSTGSTGASYLWVVTVISQSKDLTKAEGKKVADIPADLPTVTNAADGKPSIDMHGYKGSDKLVSQTLIEGTGPKCEEGDYAVVKYTGWLLDGTQFDSNWDSGSTFTAPLFSSSSGGVIKGWQQGLQGHTVGSEVLLVIPPDLGYGDQAAGSIPANSTLVFVVDILAKF